MSTNGNLGLVHIVDMGGDSRAFPVNGNGITPRDVISDFFAVDADAVEALLGERSFRIVNRGPLAASGLDRQMEHGETITVYTAEVAQGGVKGAFRS
jgi:hypothetical protein